MFCATGSRGPLLRNPMAVLRMYQKIDERLPIFTRIKAIDDKITADTSE